ncbi:unnamed protein product [Chondrus crispus]|uniref:Uncharacterized protein n=1 Tax=Chondrus crispus TaxID=2769 RepID=R7QT76_CHOCR|nr:unnamed protein product [Chondrus crispus]CDF41334.1 unnamed protein product [Chondrus crispus]|eukprot:XP_005711628.1 unnamed protein product [Chondrus crispus]
MRQGRGSVSSLLLKHWPSPSLWVLAYSLLWEC